MRQTPTCRHRETPQVRRRRPRTRSLLFEAVRGGVAWYGYGRDGAGDIRLRRPVREPRARQPGVRALRRARPAPVCRLLPVRLRRQNQPRRRKPRQQRLGQRPTVTLAAPPQHSAKGYSAVSEQLVARRNGSGHFPRSAYGCVDAPFGTQRASPRMRWCAKHWEASRGGLMSGRGIAAIGGAVSTPTRSRRRGFVSECDQRCANFVPACGQIAVELYAGRRSRRREAKGQYERAALLGSDPRRTRPVGRPG